MWLSFAVATLDPTPFLEHLDALLDGPPGCWEVVGEASWDHDLGRFGRNRGHAVIAGELRDGVWGPFEVFPLGELGADDELVYAQAERFTPITGQVRGLKVGLDGGDLVVSRSHDEAVHPVNTARDVLGKLQRDGASTVEARPDGGSVEVVEHRVVGRRDTPVEIRARFVGEQPVSWQMTLEHTYVHDVLGLARVPRLEVELQGTPTRDGVLPRAERMVFELRLVGLRVTAAQTLSWRSVRACE